jgi:myo-inositol 2-dehydrogenase/D-chiro-inositol 1-dehydrogenase
MTRLKLAVVGTGAMGYRHAVAIADSPLCDLVGVTDPDLGRRQAAAEHFGCREAESIEALLIGTPVDAVVVAAPDRLHADVVVNALQSGVHVLVEKPIADTVANARRMEAAANASGRRLAVAHILRHDSRYVGAAAAVASGAVGETVHVRASRLVPRSVGAANNGVSPIWMYQGIHDIDLVQWISGQRITEVQAVTTEKVLPAMGKQGVDAAFILGRLSDGGIAAIELGWALLDSDPSGLRAEFELVGTDGSARVAVADQGLAITDGNGYRLPDTMHWPTPYDKTAGDLAAQLTEFATALLDDREFVVPLEDAIAAVAVVEAIGDAVLSGRPTLIAEITQKAVSVTDAL